MYCNITRLAKVAGMVFMVLSGLYANACPAALLSSELNTVLKSTRKGLRLFVKSKAEVKELPLDINPLNEEGRLLFFPDESWLDEKVKPSDLLIFSTDSWGDRLLPGEPPPCGSEQIYELRDRISKKFSYLVSCSGPYKNFSNSGPVTFDPKKEFLSSKYYLYRFNSDNYMQFKNVSLKNQNDLWESIASDSQLYIHADVKNFFTMSFDSNDIESHLETYRTGSVGNLARLSFFLKILFFKIKLSLSTDVGFFSDAAHIPMMINIPIESGDFLNPGSGILYSWLPSSDSRINILQMPILDPTLIKKTPTELAKLAEPFCNDKTCRFLYGIELHKKQLVMYLKFEKNLVKQGFFPLYVPDVSAVTERSGWKLNYPREQKRSAMYFETSGLPKGQHPWDFWLKLGAHGQEQHPCPVSVDFELIKR